MSRFLSLRIPTDQIGSIFVFLILGASLSCIGVLIYDFSFSSGPPELSGQILQSRFLGALLGSLSAGYVESRQPLRWNLLPMMAIAALAMILLGPAADYPTAFLVLHFLLGLSTAAILLILSSQAIRRETRTPDIFLVLKQQTAFGLGAAATPIALFLGVFPHNSWRSMDLLTVLGTCLFLTILTQWHTRFVDASTKTAAPRQSPTTNLLSYWPLYAAIFIYAGMENGLNNWLYSWLQHVLGQDSAPVDSLLVIAIFWITVTVGRISVLLLSRKAGFRKSAVGIVASGGIAVLAGALTLNLNQYWLLAAIGILIGPIYPAILSLFSSTGKFHPLALSLASLASAAGSIVLAANLGKLISNIGSVAMPASIAICALLISSLLLSLVLRSKSDDRLH